MCSKQLGDDQTFFFIQRMLDYGVAWIFSIHYTYTKNHCCFLLAKLTFVWLYFVPFSKVQTFWEAYKIWKTLPYGLYIYLVNYEEDFFPIFCASQKVRILRGSFWQKEVTTKKQSPWQKGKRILVGNVCTIITMINISSQTISAHVESVTDPSRSNEEWKKEKGNGLPQFWGSPKLGPTD